MGNGDVRSSSEAFTIGVLGQSFSLSSETWGRLAPLCIRTAASYESCDGDL